MNSKFPLLLVMCLCLVRPLPVSALSTTIGRDINFPKNYDSTKTKVILAVVRDERFNFVDGIVSHWPPDWGTRLSYTGDAASLNAFLAAIRKIPGVGMSVILYRGRNDELRRDSPWQLYFSQARPDQLTVYINLNSTELDIEKVQLPVWSASAP